MTATTETRDYTDEESGRIEELRSELEAIDGRIAANLEVEVRSQQLEASASDVLGMLIDREHGDVVDTRSIGEQFISDEELRSWIENGARGTSPVTVNGDRVEFKSRVPVAVADVVLAEADRMGVSIADHVGKILCDRLKVPFEPRVKKKALKAWATAGHAGEAWSMTG